MKDSNIDNNIKLSQKDEFKKKSFEVLFFEKNYFIKIKLGLKPQKYVVLLSTFQKIRSEMCAIVKHILYQTH